MKKIFVWLLLTILLCSCATSSHIVKVKKADFLFNIDTEENIPVKVDVLIGQGLDLPAQPTIHHQLSYSITNLSNDKTFVGHYTDSKGQKRNAFISIFIKLSDGSVIENRQNIFFLNQVSPKATSSYQIFNVQIAKGKSIVGIENVRIVYEISNLPSVKIEK